MREVTIEHKTSSFARLVSSGPQPESDAKRPKVTPPGQFKDDSEEPPLDVAGVVESALAEALQLAAAAGEWGLVQQLAAELEKRRRERGEKTKLEFDRRSGVA